MAITIEKEENVILAATKHYRDVKKVVGLQVSLKSAEQGWKDISAKHHSDLYRLLIHYRVLDVYAGLAGLGNAQEKVKGHSNNDIIIPQIVCQIYCCKSMYFSDHYAYRTVIGIKSPIKSCVGMLFQRLLLVAQADTTGNSITQSVELLLSLNSASGAAGVANAKLNITIASFTLHWMLLGHSVLPKTVDEFRDLYAR